MGFLPRPSHRTSEESPSSSTIDVTVIPGGLTLVLQPLNRWLNKPFKENVRWKYLLIGGPLEYTPEGKRKPSTRDMLLNWIKESKAEILEEMVQKSFKVCGISNALDGTEDVMPFVLKRWKAYPKPGTMKHKTKLLTSSRQTAKRKIKDLQWRNCAPTLKKRLF